MKKLKLWLVVGAVVVASGAVALVPSSAPARAQDAPAMTQAESLTISLLQSILLQLMELNQNIERLPAAAQ